MFLALLRAGIQLKQMPRTGWLQRGVPQAENVAAHSYGVALAALALIELIDEPIDVGKALSMAVLHDLPESLTSDIPSPVKRFFPLEGRDSIKTEIERAALTEIVGELEFGDEWKALWEEFVEGKSAESRLIHDADKIDMYLQAIAYEQQTGNQQLAQFWQKPHQFNYPAAQKIYDDLAVSRSP